MNSNYITLSLAEKVVEYYNSNCSTVRKTAAHFGDISKSSVYTILTEILPNETSAEILAKNKAERHIRGGEATKNKYRIMRSV